MYELEKPGTAVSAQRAEPGTVASRNVLVLHPNLEARRILQDQLRASSKNCRTYGVATGDEALQTIERIEIDCALVSHDVLDFRGLDIVNRLTNCNTLEQIPFVVVGGADSIEAERSALTAGASEFLPGHLCDSGIVFLAIKNAISHHRLLRAMAIQNRQIQSLEGERSRYIDRTDQLAHELLTPLAAIQEFVSLVFDGVAGPINEEQGKHLAYARGGCSAIQNTVESLIVNRDLELIVSGRK